MLNRPSRQSDAPERVPSFVVDLHTVLESYVALVRRHRLLLVALPLLFAMAAGVATWIRPRQYVASMTVAVTRSDRTDDSSAASFRPYLENNAILDETIREFRLDQPPFNISRSSFLAEHYAVEPIRSTNLIVVRLRLTDPVLAAKVLNRIGDRANELVRNTSATLSGRVRDLLKAELDAAQKRKQEADLALQDFKSRNQIELMRRDVNAVLDERGQLLNLNVRIAQEQSRLIQAEAELKARTRIDQLQRVTGDDLPLVGSAPRGFGGQSGTPLSLKTEVVNPVYEVLDQQVASSRTDLAALMEQRRQLLNERKLDAAQLPLISRLYVAEAELARLEGQQQFMARVVDQIGTQYEMARLRGVDREAQMAVVDPALAPDHPEARGTLTRAIVAAALGFVLALAIIVIRQPSREPFGSR